MLRHGAATQRWPAHAQSICHLHTSLHALYVLLIAKYTRAERTVLVLQYFELTYWQLAYKCVQL